MLRRKLVNQIANRYLFDLYTRERLDRQAFFYNAFKALRFNGIDGDYAEFGSHGARTFALAYLEARRHGHRAHLWAFDSFSGFPEPQDERDAHPEWRAGKMATGVDEFHALCAAAGIPGDAYTAVPGYYEETLPEQAEPRNIALAFVDCDLYSSTAMVLDFLEPRLKHGMIVAFDDYFCWSDSQPSGERQALLDFMARGSPWNWLPYVHIGWAGASFALERVSEPSAPTSS